MVVSPTEQWGLIMDFNLILLQSKSKNVMQFLLGFDLSHFGSQTPSRPQTPSTTSKGWPVLESLVPLWADKQGTPLVQLQGILENMSGLLTVFNTHIVWCLPVLCLSIFSPLSSHIHLAKDKNPLFMLISKLWLLLSSLTCSLANTNPDKHKGFHNLQTVCGSIPYRISLPSTNGSC